MTNRDMYHTLRPNQAFSSMQCLRMVGSVAEWGNYCPTHMSQAVLPPAKAPKVKFEYDPKHAKAPAYGMENIPDNVLMALAMRMSEEGDLAESDIANRLAEEHGGELLANDIRIYRLLGGRASSSNDSGRGHRGNAPSIQAATHAPSPAGEERRKCYSFDTPFRKKGVGKGEWRHSAGPSFPLRWPSCTPNRLVTRLRVRSRPPPSRSRRRAYLPTFLRLQALGLSTPLGPAMLYPLSLIRRLEQVVIIYCLHHGSPGEI